MEQRNGSPSAISLPKGGGAIKGIGETFLPNLFTGTGNFSIPIPTSPGRQRFGPTLTLQYSTGNGNGPFGLGWQASIPRVTRKTEKGLPTYTSQDVFILSGAEDLVECRRADGQVDQLERNGYAVTRYRPRTEGMFARVERWERQGDVHWRATTRDNITSIYGRTRLARIFDPDAPARIFEWLLEETFDAKGNHILYEYAAEPSDLRLTVPFEENRRYGSQRYIRRMLYGNIPDDAPAADGRPRRTGTHHLNHAEELLRSYVFEVVFDYAIPDPATQCQYPLQPADGEQEFTDESWELRPDPFSAYRSGFEVRTLRRCHRILMYHHFAGETGVAESQTLVKATELKYQDERFSLLSSATVRGYRKEETGRWHVTGMPPVELKYSRFEPTQQRYHSITARGDDLPPFSLRHPDYAMVDLQGDGLPDVLDAPSAGFRYWRNLGGGLYDRPHPHHTQPAGVGLSQAGVAFADMAGDGLTDLVIESPQPGFYETTPEGEWRPFRKFDRDRYPSFSLSDPNVRLLDLTGDGRSDALMTTDHCFLWFRCLGETGYAPPQSVTRIRDLDRFPDVYFNDASNRVRLADMSGDGLVDIVLLHNGRVDYWPNLGYGRFGPRITMANAPRLEADFDPKRLFLVDLDGTGCADLVYVSHDRVRFWFNLSGNRWGDEQVIEGTPLTTGVTALRFADVFGTGTATLVWSYDHGTVAGGNYKALDFCGGVKPFVLTEMDNNLGATTRVAYAPSTKFYLEDLARGEPWVTTLPFPVHVVEKVEVIDHIGKTKLVTSYKYHHGYYDGHEREFRGFGRVDQFDTEVFEEFSAPGLHSAETPFTNRDFAYHVPPIETRTWFHTGIWFDEERNVDDGHPFDCRELTNRYRREFYSGDARAWDLPDHELLGVIGHPREAYRALRGAVLRTEVYARDGTAKQGHPYLVTHNRYRIKELQTPAADRNGVYLSTLAESLTYHYERNPDDPRIGHQMNLEVDDFGNVTRGATVAYPRRHPQLGCEAQQGRLAAIYTESRFINAVGREDAYHVCIPCETRQYEITGPPWTDGVQTLCPDTLDRDAVEGFQVTPFENWSDPPAQPAKRFIAWTRSYLRKDGCAEEVTGADCRLPLGEIDRLGLPWETLQACLTGALARAVFGDGWIPNTDQVLQSAGYVREQDVAELWWVPSGRQGFDAELFCQPMRFRDPFGDLSTPSYDRVALVNDKYGLLVTRGIDPFGNTITAENDYRVLQPWRLTDPNGNHSSVAFDALGLVVATAVSGRNGEGDNLEGFRPDLERHADPALDELGRHLADPLGRNDPANAPEHILAKATTRIVYDLHRYALSRDTVAPQPPTVYTLARDTHVSDDPGGKKTRIQHGFLYSDGFGRELQAKVQAEPGSVNGQHIEHRWVGTGAKIYNNKGKPVRQFEPFFSDTHDFSIECHGVSPVLFYDPLARVVCTLHSHRTYEKVVFTPWRQETWDVNDTLHPESGVIAAEFTEGTPPPRAWFDPVEDRDIGHFFSRVERELVHPTWFRQRIDPALAEARWPSDTTNASENERNRRKREAERLAACNALAHAATPTTTHLDVLGRPFLTVADNGLDRPGVRESIETRVQLDVQGNERVITDPMGIDAFRHRVDMLGRKIEMDSADAGRKQVLLAVDEKPVWSRDANGNRVRVEYDRLRRLVRTWVAPAGTTNKAVLGQAVLYGEDMEHLFGSDACHAGNHRGQVYATLDGAGLALSLAYDFKGNLLASSRRVAKDYGQDAQARGLPEGTAPDWSAVPLDGPLSGIESELTARLEAECFLPSSRFDALNRVIRATAPDHTQDASIPLLPGPAWIGELSEWLRGGSPTAPFTADGSIYRYGFNEAGLLETVELDIKDERNGEPPGQTFRIFVEKIEYNEKGQRAQIDYGNDVSTVYEYCPDTFRLQRILSRRRSGNGATLQDLLHTHDPAGNVIQIEDAAFPVVFHANQRVCPTSRYEYDPTYRLIRASGREHEATGPHLHTTAGKAQNIFVDLTQPASNGQAVRNYTEDYGYDRSGNLEEIHHTARDASWTRTQTYATAADPGIPRSNRLLTSCTGSQIGSAIEYSHDASGNITHMPHLPQLAWDHANRLRRVQLGATTGDRVHYTYDAGGRRVRKVIEKGAAPGSERLYVANFEIWREFTNPGKGRIALHVMDGQQRIALIETATGASGDPAPRIRYHLSNHLGSALMELDEEANRISYEEFYPHGETAYLAGDSWSEVERKRYRYSGKEQDDETGLYYYGARYYAAPLGRWVSCDPSPPTCAANLFEFTNNNPLTYKDAIGLRPEREGNAGVFLGVVYHGDSPYYRHEAVEGSWMSAMTKQHGLGPPGDPAYGAYSLKITTPEGVVVPPGDRDLILPGEIIDIPALDLTPLPNAASQPGKGGRAEITFTLGRTSLETAQNAVKAAIASDPAMKGKLESGTTLFGRYSGVAHDLNVMVRNWFGSMTDQEVREAVCGGIADTEREVLQKNREAINAALATAGAGIQITQIEEISRGQERAQGHHYSVLLTFTHEGGKEERLVFDYWQTMDITQPRIQSEAAWRKGGSVREAPWGQ